MLSPDHGPAESNTEALETSNPDSVSEENVFLPDFNCQGNPIIDLFAGCGGMSLGFEFAGFHPVLAIEKDAWAAETYAFNRKDVNVVTGDITQITHPKK